MDAHAEEADRRLDDEGRPNARRVEGAQLGQGQAEEAVVRVEVGDELAERNLVLEDADAARQVGGGEVLGDPADGVLRVGVEARARA